MITAGEAMVHNGVSSGNSGRWALLAIAILLSASLTFQVALFRLIAPIIDAGPAAIEQASERFPMSILMFYMEHALFIWFMVPAIIIATWIELSKLGRLTTVAAWLLITGYVILGGRM